MSSVVIKQQGVLKIRDDSKKKKKKTLTNCWITKIIKTEQKFKFVSIM